jgi:hypothetical protein
MEELKRKGKEGKGTEMESANKMMGLSNHQDTKRGKRESAEGGEAMQ